MNLFAGKEWRCRCREQTVNTVGEEEGGMNWESGTDICALSWVKQPASGQLLYNTGSPAWLRDSLEWDGRGEGGSQGREYTHTHTHTQLGLIRTVVWQKPTQHCKAIILQLKTHTHTHTRLCERSQSQNTTHYMTPFIQNGKQANLERPKVNYWLYRVGGRGGIKALCDDS